MKVTAYLTLVRLFSTTYFNSKATPTTDNNYSHYKSCGSCLHKSYGVHITLDMLLVTNSLGGGHTRTQTCIQTSALKEF